jgi:hypothetical protein
MNINDLCLCREIGKDGTKGHSEALTPIVTTEPPFIHAYSCGNHLGNYIEAGLKEGYVN